MWSSSPSNPFSIREGDCSLPNLWSLQTQTDFIERMQRSCTKPVHNNFKDCSNFHAEESHTPLISTFLSLPLSSYSCSTESLAYFSDKIDTLRLQYEAVSRQDVEDRDKNLCEVIITDSENLLTEDDRLLCLSTSHRKYLREKLRKAITQVRTILQEAVAYDSSQLLHPMNIINKLWLA